MTRVLLSAVLVVVGLLCAHAQIPNTTPNQIHTIMGKIADPSNRLVGAAVGTTDPVPVLAPAGLAVWIPSETSTVQAAGLTDPQTVTGRRLVLGSVLALATRFGDCAAPNIDTAFATATLNTVNAAQTSGTFEIPTAGCIGKCWNDITLELETSLGTNGYGRKICISEGGNFKWTGLYLRVAWDCDDSTGLDQKQCSAFVFTNAEYRVLSVVEQNLLSATVRTTCCKSTVGLQIGVCINPNAQNCCGGQPYNLAGTKCCSTATELVQWDSSPCPCRAANEIVDPDDATRVINTDCRESLGAVDATAAQTCCLPTVYPDLFDATTGRVTGDVWGQCYNENGPFRCCQTGELYDPGTDQCCAINGLQHAALPCPCATDAHCEGGQTNFKHTTYRCCRATLPDAVLPWEAEVCSAYSNYVAQPFDAANAAAAPGVFGNADYEAQRCMGFCIDTNFQLCCNGQACIRQYEKCCNTTCCNLFVGSCTEGLRRPSPNNFWNHIDFRVTYTQCTTIEHLQPIKSFLIFVLPAALLTATFGSLAIVLVFANKASNRSYSFIETAMIVLSTLAVLASLPTYFSPSFKYGLVAVIGALASILSASARIRRLNLGVLIFQLIILLYFFDPFTGNAYLNMMSYRNWWNGSPNGNGMRSSVNSEATFMGSNGLLHTTTQMWTNSVSFCVTFYDYFLLDQSLRDIDRFENGEIFTFGYCTRGWITFLLIFNAILMLLFFLLFIVTLLALILRFRKQRVLDAIELEVQKVDEFGIPILM